MNEELPRRLRDVLTAMRTGSRLFNTPFGPFLRDEYPTALSSSNVHKATFRALVRRKLIKVKRKLITVTEWETA
jgi:hypothetical protein